MFSSNDNWSFKVIFCFAGNQLATSSWHLIGKSKKHTMGNYSKNCTSMPRKATREKVYSMKCFQGWTGSRRERGANKLRVSFAKELISDVKILPRINKEDKGVCFYSELDFLKFRLEALEEKLWKRLRVRSAPGKLQDQGHRLDRRSLRRIYVQQQDRNT
jgi:hypothetical protein